MAEDLKAHHIIFSGQHDHAISGQHDHAKAKQLLRQHFNDGTLQDQLDKLLYRENEQYTALVWAITQHHKDMVRILLNYGAKIKQPGDTPNELGELGDANNWNALHYAASWGNPEIIKMLFDHVKTLENKVELLEQRDNETGETPKEILQHTMSLTTENESSTTENESLRF